MKNMQKVVRTAHVALMAPLELPVEVANAAINLTQCMGLAKRAGAPARIGVKTWGRYLKGRITKRVDYINDNV